jgi:hypothetical protein
VYRWLSRTSLAVSLAALALTLVMVSGVFPRSQVHSEPPTSHCLFGLCGTIDNDPGSQSWLWVSDNWPAELGAHWQVPPGGRSTDYLRDTDAVGIPEHCTATDGHGRRFEAGWHKVTDWYDGRLTLDCDQSAS